MSTSEHSRLTFGQANGMEAIPTQSQLGTISEETRAALWAVIYSWFHSIEYDGYIRPNQWPIFIRWWVSEKHRMIDEAPKRHEIGKWERLLKTEMLADIPAPYNLAQYLLSCPEFNNGLIIATALEKSRAAYRVVEDLIAPFTSERDLAQIRDAYSGARSIECAGAVQHLNSAATMLTAGNWSAAAAEAVAAVEATARTVSGSPKSDLGSILRSMKSSGVIPHSTISEMITKLYAYASDEGGIRHSLSSDGNSKVTENEAMFVFGACSAAVSYLSKLKLGK